jgi:hypothetical protein
LENHRNAGLSVLADNNCGTAAGVCNWANISNSHDHVLTLTSAIGQTICFGGKRVMNIMAQFFFG